MEYISIFVSRNYVLYVNGKFEGINYIHAKDVFTNGSFTNVHVYVCPRHLAPSYTHTSPPKSPYFYIVSFVHAVFAVFLPGIVGCLLCICLYLSSGGV